MKEILKKYTFTELFTYTGVSKGRIIWQAIKYLCLRLFNVRYAIANVNNYKMKLDFKTPGLSRTLYIYGKRELPDLHVMYETLQPGMVVADIGANIGYYALLEAQIVGKEGHVHAFEPDPRNLPLLKDNIQLNNMDSVVTVYDQAISNKTETKMFQLGERSNVSSFVGRTDIVDSVSVSCISLAEFEHIEKVDMLRMDAEGYECKIIEGIIPYLRENRRPMSIMLEVHSKLYDKEELNFDIQLQALLDIGFKASHMISNVGARELCQELGYRPAETWTETKYKRDLYRDVDNESVRTCVSKGRVRALLLQRS